MPIDYTKYPKNWKTEIRPAILERAKNRCEFCMVENKSVVLRGEMDGRPIYQLTNGYGSMYSAADGEYLGTDYEGMYGTNEVRIVLTIAHLDHDVSNNCYSNLAALCQRCHLTHDKAHHVKNAKATRIRKMGMADLFEP